jgi:hypothetical protein
MIVAALDGRADLFERLTRREIADAGIGLDILAGAGLAPSGMAASFAARSNAADLPESILRPAGGMRAGASA